MDTSRATQSGRTSPEPSAAMMGRTSRRSSRRLQASYRTTCMFLDLSAGGVQASSWAMDSPLPGGYSTPSTGECPREGVASSLSRILLEEVPERFSLTPKACLGMVRRATLKGRTFPVELREALETQAMGA